MSKLEKKFVALREKVPRIHGIRLNEPEWITNDWAAIVPEFCDEREIESGASELKLNFPCVGREQKRERPGLCIG